MIIEIFTPKILLITGEAFQRTERQAVCPAVPVVALMGCLNRNSRHQFVAVMLTLRDKDQPLTFYIDVLEWR